MEHLKNILLKLYRYKWLKYVIVSVVAALILGFLGENSIWNLVSQRARIAELRDEIDDYTERYTEDLKQVDALDHDPKAIRKIARERYFMKADDEDIFVLSDDEQPQKTTENETTE